MLINNGYRTKWNPIRSVIIQVISKKQKTAKRESDLSMSSMIKDRFWRHEVLLTINQN